MSTILNKLKELSNYYRLTRGVGHTTRMLMGITTANLTTNGVYDVHAPATILTHDGKFADELNKRLEYYCGVRKNVKAIPFSSNYDKILRGRNTPILLDNALLQQLFDEAVEEIEMGKSIQDKLDEKIEKLEREKKELAETVVKLKCEFLIDYQEDNVNKEVPQPTASFLSPLDILTENKEVKSVEIKVEYYQ